MTAFFKRYFYLLCVLPDIGEFGSTPPLTKQGLLTVVTESEGPVDIVQVLLLSDDLLEREAVLTGERDPDTADPAVLSLQQVKGEQPLPHFLRPHEEDEEESSDDSVSGDPIWQYYFQYAFDRARSSRSPFLRAWVGFEVGMRNALARLRAEALDLDPDPYMVAQGLGDPEFPFEGILEGWRASSNPLEALEAQDRVRWNWVAEHEQWYSFNSNEVAAYTARIILLHRWRRINQGDENKP